MTARSALDDAALADLARHFRGALIRPGDPPYDAARRIWNGAIDRHPGLVARCTGAADVRAAVRFARERDLLVAVRGGGHNVAGTAVCDGGVVIDLAPMWEAVRPYSTGRVYVNFLGEEGQDRMRAAYGEVKYERLRAVKRTYDPANFFRLNQNIRP
jgi:FAD/FMN-containing dehydrogenase